MLQALPKRIDYEIGRTEIHIGHPERHKIVTPKEFLKIVMFEAPGPPTLHYLIKIIHTANLEIIMRHF